MPVQEAQIPNDLSTEHLQPDLKKHSVRGGLLTVTSQGAQFLIQSVSTVVLARLLTPADFGLVAMVSAITGLGQAFADLGLSEATIQRKDITHDQITALFWINAAIGLGLTIVTAGLAPVLASFYREPRLVAITLVMSLTFLIGGFRVQADALLKRQMRFSSLAVRDVATYVFSVALAIILALRGYGYWVLVALPLSLNGTRVILSWLMIKWRPGLPRRGANVRSMVTFGGNVAASYFMTNINRSADSVLIGWHLGAAPLGLYSRAYNLLMLPVRQLSIPATSVAVPAFSRLQNDPERFARYYLRAANLMMWISAPVFAFLFVAAEPVIALALGNQWRGSAPVFKILVFSALGQLLFDSIIWLFVSRGQSGRMLRLLFVISPIIVLSFAVGLPFGIDGVAFCGSLVLVGILPWVLKFAFRDTTLTLKRLARAVLCPVSLSVVGIIIAEIAVRAVVPEHIYSQLLVPASVFAIVYLLAALVRPVREELTSIWGLLGVSGVSRQGAPA